MDKIELYSLLDFILAPFYIAIIYFLASATKARKIVTNPVYKYYLRGLQLKLIGAVGFFLIYTFYYQGGDSTAFFQSSGLLSKLITSHTYTYFSILFGNLSQQNFTAFWDAELCCPQYYKDFNTFSVVRYISPLVLLSGFSYLSTTILFSYFTYICIWRLFLVFTEIYPQNEKRLAIAILYTPTVLFWGSGVLKDSFAFAGACAFTYVVYTFFIKKQRNFKYLFLLAASAYLMITTKPYVFVALLPGSATWIFFQRISRIQSVGIKILLAPVIIGIGLLITSLVTSRLKDSLGYYGDVDNALKKAQINKIDLARDVYGSNSFDIGEFDGSTGSALRLFPAAVIAGLFRPFIFEARNFVNFITAIENTLLLLLTLKVLLQAGPFRLLRYIFSEPLILFSFIFAIFFAFAVGLSTSNFGALARYKIPAVPFFCAMLFIIEYKIAEARKLKKIELESENESIKQIA
ncbi:MAG: hypothetical protein ACK4GL_03610 [Flavobacteriales bacterium]